MLYNIASGLGRSAFSAISNGVVSRVAGSYISGLGNPIAVATSTLASSVAGKCFNKITHHFNSASGRFAMDVFSAVASTLIVQNVGQLIDPEFNCMTIAKINLIYTGLFIGLALAVLPLVSKKQVPTAKEEALNTVQVKESKPQPRSWSHEIGVTIGGVVAILALFNIVKDITKSRSTDFEFPDFIQDQCYFLSKAGGHMMDRAREVCSYAEFIGTRASFSVKLDVASLALYTAIYKIGIRALMELGRRVDTVSDTAKKNELKPQPLAVS